MNNGNWITMIASYTTVTGKTFKMGDVSLVDYANQSISSLTTSQIASLSTEQISVLTTADIVTLTTSQVAALNTAQFASLTTADIRSLTTEQIAALTTNEVAHGLTSTQVAALTTSQVIALSTTQVSVLGSAQTIALVPTEIAALTSKGGSGQALTAQVKELVQVMTNFVKDESAGSGTSNPNRLPNESGSLTVSPVSTSLGDLVNTLKMFDANGNPIANAAGLNQGVVTTTTLTLPGLHGHNDLGILTTGGKS
jgi:hypothetical protein